MGFPVPEAGWIVKELANGDHREGVNGISTLPRICTLH